MKSMQNRLNKFYTTFADIATLDIYHFEKPDTQKAPYAVWAEEGESDSFQASNIKAEQSIAGSLDYYTQTEFDSMVDTIQDTFNSIEGCSWSLNSVLYEDGTKLIHYNWNWELI